MIPSPTPPARRCAVLLLALLAGLAPAALAQKPYAIPEAPAFTFLGVTPARIDRPTTPRDFFTDVLSAVDSTGAVQQGFALDVAPWSLIPGLAIPLSEYQGNPFKYALANTTVSLGTVRSAGSTAATDVGLGLRITLLNRGDPMTDPAFTSGLATALAPCLATVMPDTPEEQILTCAVNAVQPRRAAWLKDHWNQYAVSVAAATGLRLDESRFTDREFLGWAVWSTAALPFLNRRGQLLAQLRYERRNNLGAADEDTNLFTYGARAFYGSSTVNLFAEVVGINDSESVVHGEANSGRWSGGVEFRASDTLWLSTGFGSAFADAGMAEQTFLIAGLRWDIASRPRLTSLLDTGSDAGQ